MFKRETKCRSSESVPYNDLQNRSLHIWNLDHPRLRKWSTKHRIEHGGSTGKDVPMTFHFLSVGTCQERDVTQNVVVKYVAIGWGKGLVVLPSSSHVGLKDLVQEFNKLLKTCYMKRHWCEESKVIAKDVKQIESRN